NCLDSLTALDLPSDMLQGLHDFVLDLRVYTVVTVLQQAAHGETLPAATPCRQRDTARDSSRVPRRTEGATLRFEVRALAPKVKGLVAKDDWAMDNRGVTSLPGLFEQHVQRSLKLLDDVVACKGGETSVFALEANTTRVSGLFIEIVKVLLSCLEELATRSHTEADRGQ
ncbi:unnamed protein product, partial [Lampetra fluviatilis]